MFVFILIGMIHGYDKIQQESNVDKQILKEKVLEQKIVFKQSFPEIPIIILSINDLNIKGEPYQFEIHPKDITQGGFVLKYSKYTNNDVKIKVSWMAIFDPRIEVSYVTQLGNKKQFTVPVSDNGIFYSLIGMSTKQSVQAQLVEVKDKLAHFKIIGDAEMIKLCILSGPKQSINFQRVNFVETEKQKWPKQDKMHLQLVKKDLKKPQEDQVMFAGLVGFKVESKNLGLTMRLKEKLIFGVNNSKLKGLYINLLTYTADQTLYIMDKSCVELFKECQFQGEKLSICSYTNGEQPKNKFSFKSYMVPDGKVFELIDGEKKAKLEGAMSCLDEIILG